MLTHENLKKYLHYDSDTGTFTKLEDNSRIKLSTQSRGYHQIYLLGKSYLAHRIAWFYVYGYMPQMIDHIDQNKQNNKIENLRETNAQKNALNRNPRRSIQCDQEIDTTVSELDIKEEMKLVKQTIIELNHRLDRLMTKINQSSSDDKIKQINKIINS